ncbi:MAG: hypothetical protein P1U72_11410 [Paracoccaceae bacterium]|nr:hypothetical protein [Paracoccaceae bacterium]
MRALPIFAMVVIGSFATLGFAAGTLMKGQELPSSALSENVVSATPVATLTAPDTQADTILRAAEARAANAVPAKTTLPASDEIAPVDATRQLSTNAARPHLVKMANVTLPVRKAASVSFVVADLAVAVTDAESAARYEIPQNAARLQAAIETAMASAADTPILRGVAIDSHELSGKLTSELQQTFTDVEDVLFLTLYKHDVGYN